MSAGGRLANIHMHKERRRKLTSMVNELEAKRLNTIKKQIQIDRITERNFYERNEKKIFKSNDDLKAFQKALLHRITTVRETSRLAGGIRPLVNLGRYGGATIDQIKIESEKFKPIRNPEQRRMIKTKILLEQGKRDGRIKQFDSSVLGDVAESILNLEKVSHPPRKLQGIITDVADPKNEDLEEPSDEVSMCLRIYFSCVFFSSFPYRHPRRHLQVTKRWWSGGDSWFSHHSRFLVPFIPT